jgi:hypothetical protein
MVTGDLVRLAGRCSLFLTLAACGASLASAQSAVDIGISFGNAWDKANASGIENAASANAFGSCSTSSGDIDCLPASSLNGFFLGFGGDIMLYKKFGVGAEFQIQPAQKKYGPLQDRQIFYDVNGIYQPIATKRVALRIEGGIGGARTSFSYSQSGCVGTAVCTTQSEPVGSATHFQVHAGVGVQIYITEHLFVRPQFDYRYVTNFTQQFNSNSVPAATIWVGYDLGGH